MTVAVSAMSLASVAAVVAIAYAGPKVVPDVCFVQDQRTAEQTLIGAGFKVEWVTGEAAYRLTATSPCHMRDRTYVSDETWVVAQEPQGSAPRGATVRLVWQPPISSV
jgi:hypothetical protein